MASNADEMVPPVQDDFPNLRADVPGADARGRTAYPVELTWFRRRLARGVARLRLFLVTRAAVRPAEPVTAPDGTRLTSHDQRPTTDDAVFGQGRFWRQACTALGPEGCSPLDAELSWPARGSSDLRREWAVDGTPDESSRESQTGRARILGRSLSVHALESGVAAAGGAVPPVDDQPPAAGPPAARGTIRVVPAEGPGVPLVQPPPQTSPVRLGKGQPHGTKQEAVVTGLSTMAPYPRTPPEVGAALGQEASRPEPAARPRSEGQELRATWAGKAVAMRRLGERVAQRHGPHLQPRVALTEGAEVWPPHGVTPVPEDPVIWDLSHATASLGETAKALRGATHPQRLAWVRASLEPRLAGQTDAVITALETDMQDPPGTETPRQAVRRTVGSDRRNQPALHDDAYRARGWPIGTGGGRGLGTPRERSHGAGGDALDHRRRSGGARPAGGAAPRPWGCRWAVASPTTPSPALWPVRPRAGVGRSSRAGVGGLIHRLSTNFGHTHIIKDMELRCLMLVAVNLLEEAQANFDELLGRSTKATDV